MVLTVAIDGLNRSGKGTQLHLLKRFLQDRGLPAVILRGDGSREGKGLSEGDPCDEWWQRFRSRLADAVTSMQRFACWNEAADRLAEEYLHWRDSLMPQQVQRVNAPCGVILLDRSLLSRLMLAADERGSISLEGLYRTEYHGTPVTWETMMPDRMLVLVAQQDTLLARLDPDDPKYGFRSGLILEKYSLFQAVLDGLPQELQGVTRHVDADQSIESVWRVCLEEAKCVIARK